MYLSQNDYDGKMNSYVKLKEWPASITAKDVFVNVQREYLINVLRDRN